MPAPVSTEEDWYSVKAPISVYLKREENEIEDTVMDDAYKWVNAQLGREKIDFRDTIIKAELLLDFNLEQAMKWFACHLMTFVIASNQNPGRLIPDAQITNQSFGQGEMAVSYEGAEPSKHNKELTTPNFHMSAQRSMDDFFDSLLDSRKKQKKSLIARSNRVYASEPIDYNNRLRESYMSRYLEGSAYE